MTREQIGILLLALAIIVHALLPRYELQMGQLADGRSFPYRLDRWTGRVETGAPNQVFGPHPQDWYFQTSNRDTE